MPLLDAKIKQLKSVIRITLALARFLYKKNGF